MLLVFNTLVPLTKVFKVVNIVMYIAINIVLVVLQ